MLPVQLLLLVGTEQFPITAHKPRGWKTQGDGKPTPLNHTQMRSLLTATPATATSMVQPTPACTRKLPSFQAPKFCRTREGTSRALQSDASRERALPDPVKV